MPSRAILTASEKEKAAALIAQGVPLIEVARQLNRIYSVITVYAKSIGEKPDTHADTKSKYKFYEKAVIPDKPKEKQKRPPDTYSNTDWSKKYIE